MNANPYYLGDKFTSIVERLEILGEKLHNNALSGPTEPMKFDNEFGENFED